jgi:hypothetical protein
MVITGRREPTQIRASYVAAAAQGRGDRGREEGDPREDRQQARGGGMENMMSMVLQRLDAISAQQREAAARVDRLEMGVLSLLPARATGGGLEAVGAEHR